MSLLSRPVRIAAVSITALMFSFAGAANAHPGLKDAEGCHTPLLTGVEHCHSHDLRRDDTSEDELGFQTGELDNRTDSRGYEREDQDQDQDQDQRQKS